MDDSSGCRGCIGLVGSIVGLVAGLISIISFFFSDADSFFSAAEQFWSSTVLGAAVPSVTPFLAQVNDLVTQFAESSPLQPWWTALLLFVVGGLLKYVVEWQLLLDLGLREVLILLLPLVAWMWVFSGTVGIVGIAFCIAGYIVFTLGISFVLERVFEGV